MSEPQVIVEESADALATMVAERALAALVDALAARPVAHLVLTGGGILERVFDALAASDDRESVDWTRVHVWWGDERYVPAGSDERNDVPATAKLLDRLPLDPAHVHHMPASDGPYGEDVDAAAQAYAEELAAVGGGGSAVQVPRFDLVMLGVGPDGHCASLFPGHPGTQVTDRSVIGVRDSPKPPPVRLSLTFPALDAADQVWFVASTEGKADAVARALGGADRTEVPSAGPRGRIATYWLIDRDAASELPDQ